MREITKRLEQMSNQWGYEQREEERITIVKEHLLNAISEIDDLNLQKIAEQTDLIHDHYIFNEWMIYSYDINLFFNIDTLDIVNDFLKEYGETDEILDYVLVHDYAARMVFEHIDEWAQEDLTD